MTPSVVGRARPTRVLMYTAYFEPEYSGAALQALTLAKELRRRGHRVEFITNRWPGLGADLEVEGFKVHRLNLGRTRKHRELLLWFNLAHYAWRRRKDFDVLHSHGAYFANAFIGPLARVLGMKSVIKASLADDDLEDLERPFVGTLHRWMLQRIDACVAISQDLVQEFLAGGLDRASVHHVPNGVDTTHFQAVPEARAAELRRELGLPQGRPIVLYVGVLDQRKNIEWLAQQWIVQDAFGTDGLLLAVGPRGRDDVNGALHRRLAEMARAHPARFALRDFHTDVTPYYQCARLAILPSAKEGLPNVVLEAMACGLPCVAARASGTRELIVDGETGCTYPPGDAAGLAAAVRRCLGPQAPALGARARGLAHARYAIVAVADAYERIYTRLLAPRKRILYVENGIGYGGAVICLRHLVRNLDPVRFCVMVVTGLGDEKYQDIAAEASWKHIPDKRLNVMSWKRLLGAARGRHWPPGARWLANQLISRLDDLVNFLPCFLQTLWTVVRFRPDLVHVNNEPLCNRSAILAGKLLGVPVVAHVRGDQQGSPLMHSLFRLPDFFIAVSRWVSDSIGRIGVPDHKRTWIYDGIELDALDMAADGAVFRDLHGLPPRAFVVGLVGLLIPWKGQALFLDAVEHLVPDMPDAVFAIVGGTPEEFEYFEAALRQRAEAGVLKGRVVFTGHVSDMTHVYKGLDVVLSASIAPEPLGTVLIEAMTMARPVVAPAHGGAMELIEDARSGLLFTPGDALDLAAKIRTLHADPGLRATLGAAARQRAQASFAISEHVSQVAAVYDRLLGVPGTGAP